VKWLFIILGGIALLIAAVRIIGMAIPEKHTATRSAKIPAPPAEVWKVISNPDAFPAWRPDVKRVERLADQNGSPSWREFDAHGQSIPFVVEESSPPSLLVTRITDPNLPFGGTWTFEIQPSGSGSTVRITERGEIHNPVFRFVARFFMGYDATMDQYLKALSTRFGDTAAAGN
jgi:uncharacterized protein YndB with AHSA1/START domain